MTRGVWHGRTAVVGGLMVWALCAGWHSFAQSQDNTNVTGQVVFKDLPPNLDNTADTGFFWRIPALPHDGNRPPLDQIQVVLTHTKRARDAQPAKINVDAHSVSPGTMVVAPGTTIDFTNQGQSPVELYVVGRSNIEPLSLQKEGDSAKIALDKPGRYLFQSAAATSAQACVIVTSSVADAGLVGVSSKKARFDLGQVEPGTYQLQIYFRGTRVLEEKVRVSQQGKLDKESFLLTGADLQQ